MRLLTTRDLEQALPIRESITAMAAAFVDIAQGQSRVTERQSLRLSHGTGLLMGAAGDHKGLVAKLVSVMPDNAARGLPGTPGLLVLNDDQTGMPAAIMDGTTLTALRTAAVSACASDLLARRDVKTALLVGTGTQAARQLASLDSIRDFECIRVLDIAPHSAAAFIERHSGRVRPRLELAGPNAVQEAEVIVTATNSETAVFAASEVSPGTHISAIGSFHRGMCEIDPQLMQSARVFVDSRVNAAAEAGELIAAAEAGFCCSDDWFELGSVIDSGTGGRTASQDITLFKTVGHGVFDLYAAQLALQQATARGIGQTWEP